MVLPTGMETLLFSFGGGGLIGYMAARALRVIAKIAGVIIGALVLGLAFLAYTGIIDVHWQAVQSQAESFAYNASAQILAALNHTASTYAHPTLISAEGTPIAAGTGFVLGFGLALKR